MGAAIIKAVTKSQSQGGAKRSLPFGDKVIGYDVDRERLKAVAKKYKARIASSSVELVKKCNIIVLAVKPQDMDEVLKEIRNDINTSKVLVSIAAGVKTGSIEGGILKKTAVVRVMPNMPAFIQAGISAVCRGRFATDKDLAVIKDLFRNIGEVVDVEEDVMDAVTAISGSGPAYFFYLVEVLIKMGRELGLKDAIARKLAIETALGSARILKETEEAPEVLRASVTSKGGTTEAAFKIFAKNNLEEILKNGIREAFMKARGLPD